MWALTACCVLTFGVVCAVLSMHMDVWHVLPVRHLPFTPLCLRQVLVGAL